MTFGLQGPRASCMTYGHENEDSKEKTQQGLKQVCEPHQTATISGHFGTFRPIFGTNGKVCEIIMI